MKSADKETAVVNVYASAVYLELVFANTLKKVNSLSCLVSIFMNHLISLTSLNLIYYKKWRILFKKPLTQVYVNFSVVVTFWKE